MTTKITSKGCIPLPKSEIERYKRLFFRDQSNKMLPTKKERIGKFCEYVRSQIDTSKTSLNTDHVGAVFGITGGSVRKYMKRFAAAKKKVSTEKGRPRTLNDEQEKLVLEEILKRVEAKTPMGRTEITSYVQSNFNVEISDNWVDSFVKRNPKIQFRHAYAMEKARLEISQDELKEYFSILENQLTGANPHAVLNLDESWELSRNPKTSKLVVGPKGENGKIYFKEAGNPGHLTVMPIISVAGDLLHTAVIINNKSVSATLSDKGYVDSEHYSIYSSSSGYINEEIFGMIVEKVLTPWAEKLEREEIQERFLIMDGCLSHTTEKLEDIGIIPIFMPAHSSHLVQALDLVIFQSMKQNMKRYRKDPKLSEMDNRILKMFDSIERAAIRTNILSAFERAGIVVGRDGNIKIEKGKVLEQEHVKSLPEKKKKRKRVTVPRGRSKKEKEIAEAEEEEPPKKKRKTEKKPRRIRKIVHNKTKEN